MPTDLEPLRLRLHATAIDAREWLRAEAVVCKRDYVPLGEGEREIALHEAHDSVSRFLDAALALDLALRAKDDGVPLELAERTGQ